MAFELDLDPESFLNRLRPVRWRERGGVRLTAVVIDGGWGGHGIYCQSKIALKGGSHVFQLSRNLIRKGHRGGKGEDARFLRGWDGRGGRSKPRGTPIPVSGGMSIRLTELG